MRCVCVGLCICGRMDFWACGRVDMLECGTVDVEPVDFWKGSGQTMMET